MRLPSQTGRIVRLSGAPFLGPFLSHLFASYARAISWWVSDQHGPPNLDRYSNAPHYNMRAVEEATGISSRTLRSWERRYGVPSPGRSAGGRRLYSEADIALIQWLREQVARGISISRAISRISASDTEPQGSLSPIELERLQLRLLQAIDWMDEDEVLRIIQNAVTSAPIESVIEHLLQPVMYRVGELWAAGRMSVASEHFGTHIVRSVLSDLLRSGPQPWLPYHVLVGCAPGEQHDVGPLVLAIFLRQAGFRVSFLGASLEAQSLMADVHRLQPDAVCLSATTAGAAAELRHLFNALAGSFTGVLAYGGSAFLAGSGVTEPPPGVNFGDDARRAVQALTQALEEETPSSQL